MGKYNVIRSLYAFMYFCTSIINLVIAVKAHDMLRSLADTALVPMLAQLIRNVPDYMFVLGLLFFAASQITFAVLLLGKGIFVKLGSLGGIVFHLSIIPFGVFNFMNLFIAIPLIFIFRKDFYETIPALIFRKKTQDA